MATDKPTVAFIGFGEAGQAIAAGLHEAGIETIAAWDILFPTPDGEKLKHAAAAIGVRRAGSAADAVRGADAVISAVTAASSVDAAQSVKQHLARQPFFLDINSVSPGRKQETAKLSATPPATSTSPCWRRSIRHATRRRCCSPDRTRRRSRR